jgi:hypothetical protein
MGSDRVRYKPFFIGCARFAPGRAAFPANRRRVRGALFRMAAGFEPTTSNHQQPLEAEKPI